MWGRQGFGLVPPVPSCSDPGSLAHASFLVLQDLGTPGDEGLLTSHVPLSSWPE